MEKKSEKETAVREMTVEEMRKYTAAELERMMPKRYNKTGYWYYSKDRQDLNCVVLDWKAALK